MQIIILSLILMAVQTIFFENSIYPDNKKEITANVLVYFPPEYNINSDGEPSGFAVDILEEIARNENLKIKYNLFDSWHELSEAFDNGIGDIIPNARITKEENDNHHYTRPMETFQIKAFKRNSSKLSDLNDIKNKKILLCEGNIAVKLFQKHPKTLTIIKDKPEDAIFSLLSGEADVFIYPEPITMNILSKLGLTDKIKAFGKPLLEVKRGIKIRSSQAELAKKLDYGLEKLLKSPKYKEIYKKYYAKKNYWTRKKVIWIVIAIIITSFVLSLFWRYISLKKMNVKLEELKNISDKKYDLTFSQANIAMVHSSIDGKIMAVNDRFCNITGYSRDELLMLKFSDFTYPEDLKSESQNFNSLSEGNSEGYKIDKRYIKKNGDIVWVHLSLSAIKDDKANILYLIGIVEDISSRKQQHEKILSESIFNALNSSLIAVYVYSFLENTNKYINSRYTEILGYSLEDLNAMDTSLFITLFHSNDKQAVLNHMNNVYESAQGEAFEIRYRFKHKGGHWVWCHSRDAVLERDKYGQAKTLIGSFIDITSIMETEEELRRSLSRMQAIFDNSGLGLKLFHLDGKILEYNKRLVQILGYADDEIQLNSIADFAYPDDVQKELKLLDDIKNNKISTFSLKKRFIKKDNSILWTMIYISKVSSLDEDQLAIGIIQDISKEVYLEETEKRKSRLYNKILDNSKDAVFLLNRSFEYVLVSKAYLEFHDMSEKQLIGKTPACVHGEEFYELRVKPLFEKVLNGEEILFDSWIDTKGKGKIYAASHIIPYIPDSETGVIEGLIDTVRDISEHFKMEEENQKQEQLLLQQSKLAAMGEMIGAIAHQWRQPLSAIGVSLINLKEAFEYNGLSQEYLDKKIDSAEKNLQFMSKTIDDFRNFYAPSKSKIIFSVQTAIKESINIVDAQMRDHLIKLHFEEKEGNWNINGYPGEFKQVLMNILNNARDAIKEKSTEKLTDEGEIIINLIKENDSIIVSIADNGGGIPEEYIDRVFEPYFTNKEQGKGTGIGLYMSKIIIENNMEGSLEVLNSEKGAVFKIQLMEK